jgi:preprotein translocase subunit YajC
VTLTVSPAALLAATKSSSSGGFGSLLLLAPVVVVMLFVLRRASRSRRTQAASMQSAVEPGVEVMTGGGLYGTVRAVHDDGTFALEVAPGVELRYAIAAIARIIVPEDPHREDVEEHSLSDGQAPDPSA